MLITTLANEDPLSTGTNTNIPLRFAGQYFDQETGFHYNYFRTYIPDLGRYSQSDPIGLIGGWNTFGYVDGDPINLADYYGLQRWKKKFSKDHTNCIGIKKKIEGLIGEMNKRVPAILENPQKLPINHTLGNALSASVDGHIEILEKQIRPSLEHYQNRYKNECDDPDGPPKSPFQDIAPWKQPASQSSGNMVPYLIPLNSRGAGLSPSDAGAMGDNPFSRMPKQRGPGPERKLFLN